MPENGETAPLLGQGVPNLARDGDEHETAAERIRRATNVRAITHAVLSVLFIVALVCMFFFWDKLSGAVGRLPKDPHEAALYIMKNAPVIVSPTLFA